MADAKEYYRHKSRIEWYATSLTNTTTIEQINCGSLQRIADATELMAKNYLELQRDRDNYKTWYNNKTREFNTMRLTVSALRGQITKLKKAAKASVTTDEQIIAQGVRDTLSLIGVK